MKKVLGQLVVKKTTVRLSVPLAGGGQTDGSPLVRSETPGRVVDHDDRSAVFTNYTTRPPFDAMQLHAGSHARKAVTSGEPQYRVFETDPADPRPTHAFHLYADPEGNVTAHRSRQFWEGSRNYADAEKTMEDVKKAHEKALGEGDVYHKETVHPQFAQFVRAIGDNPGDTSNHAALTDWLLENGHDDLADIIRHHPNAKTLAWERTGKKNPIDPFALMYWASLDPATQKRVAENTKHSADNKAQFSAAVRLSEEDAGPPKWRPDFSQSPVVHEHHGWVHGPSGAVKEEDPGRHFPADMFGGRNHERVALKRLIHNDNPKAVRSDPTLQVSDDDSSSTVRPPRLTHFYLDSQGNVTAHSSPQHDRMYSGSHLEYNEAIPRVSRQDYWDWLKLHHDDAVAKGQVYHRVAVHPQWKAFIREADKDPELTKAMAHDWAMENGYDDLVEAMKANGMLYPGHTMMELGGKTPDWLRNDVKAHKASQLSMAEPVRVLGKVVQMAQPPAVDMRHRYHPVHRPTDLSDSEWLKVKHHFPTYKEAGGRVTPIRVYLNATMYRLETGTPLRALPPDFPRWGSVHSVEDHIAHKGLWPVILEETGRTHLLPNLQKMIHGAVELPPGGLPPKLPVASPVAMSHGDHSYGCLHVNLPPAVAAEVLAFGSQIPDEELGKEGRETCPHVTVRYGLKPRVGVEDVQSNLLGAGPAHYSLGKLGLFPGKDCDVLYVSVDSPDLAAINVRTSALDHDEIYGAYVPHVTVAHLKKGLGSKYLSQDPFCGICCCATQVVFSPKSGDDFFVNLTDQAPPSADKLPGGKADNVPPGTYGEEEAKGMKDEMEHTSDPGIAAEIARDHLISNAEADPGYGYYDVVPAAEAAISSIAKSKDSGNISMERSTKGAIDRVKDIARNSRSRFSQADDSEAPGWSWKTVLGVRVRVWGHSQSVRKLPENGQHEVVRMSQQGPAEGDSAGLPKEGPLEGVPGLAGNERKMPVSEPHRLQELRGTRDNSLPGVARVVRPVLQGHGAVPAEAHVGQNRHERELLPSQLSVGRQEDASQEHQEERLAGYRRGKQDIDGLGKRPGGPCVHRSSKVEAGTNDSIGNNEPAAERTSQRIAVKKFKVTEIPSAGNGFRGRPVGNTGRQGNEHFGMVEGNGDKQGHAASQASHNDAARSPDQAGRVVQTSEAQKVAEHGPNYYEILNAVGLSLGDRRVLGKVVHFALPFTPLDTQYVLDHDRGTPMRAGFWFPANAADKALAQAKEAGKPVATAAPFQEKVVHVFADPQGRVTAHVSRRAQALRKGGTDPGTPYHHFLSELHDAAAEAGHFYKRPGGEVE